MFPFLLLLFWIIGAASSFDSPYCRQQSFYVMGMVTTLEACGLEERELDKAISQAYQEIEGVDLLMSLYREDSELSRINRQPVAFPLVVSESTFQVLAESMRIAEASRGAFDPTVGPLVRLWGFHRGDPAVPGPGELAIARAKVGFRHLRLDPRASTLWLGQNGVEIDLGGIAKGYAVDRALSTLEAAGAIWAVVDLGESSVCLFNKEDSRTTAFTIRNAVRPATFEIHQGCVSTSGSDQQGFQVEGEWLSQIIDPSTGWPVRDSVSATVVGNVGEGMRVDALSTAGLVAGSQGAIDLWSRFGVEGILYYRVKSAIESVSTPGFPLLQTNH